MPTLNFLFVCQVNVWHYLGFSISQSDNVEIDYSCVIISISWFNDIFGQKSSLSETLLVSFGKILLFCLLLVRRQDVKNDYLNFY